MPRPYEITILVLGMGVLGYVFVIARDDIRRIEHRTLLLIAFAVQFCGWVLSAMNRLFPSIIPFSMGCLFTTTATLLLVAWCYRSTLPERGGKP